MNAWDEFFSMGGYGVYVWGSLLAVVLAAVVEVVELHWQQTAPAHEDADTGGPPS